LNSGRRDLTQKERRGVGPINIIKNVCHDWGEEEGKDTWLLKGGEGLH